jgi:hypothetical protein
VGRPSLAAHASGGVEVGAPEFLLLPGEPGAKIRLGEKLRRGRSSPVLADAVKVGLQSLRPGPDARAPGELPEIAVRGRKTAAPGILGTGNSKVRSVG